MRNRNVILKLCAALILLGLTSPASPPAQQLKKPPVLSPSAPPQSKTPVSAAAKPNGSVVNLVGLTSAQFRALAPNALVSYQGQTVTKANFMAMRLKEFQANGKLIASQPPVNLPAVQAQFAQKQQSELAARNAQLAAEWQRVEAARNTLATLPAYVALSKEATDLVGRYNSAPPAEKIRQKQRAQQLYDQLLQMERAAAPH